MGVALEPGDTHANQPDGAAGGVVLLKQGEGGAIDGVVLVNGLWESGLAGEGGEVLPAELDLDGGPGKVGLSQPIADTIREFAEGAAECGEVGHVGGEGGLPADGLGLALRFDGAVVNPTGAAGEVVPVLAEALAAFKAQR